MLVYFNVTRSSQGPHHLGGYGRVERPGLNDSANQFPRLKVKMMTLGLWNITLTSVWAKRLSHRVWGSFEHAAP